MVALGQHSYLEHKQEGVKICKHCGFQTISVSELERHRLDVHGNTRGRRNLEIDCINQELVTRVNEVYKGIASPNASVMMKLNSRDLSANEQVDDVEKETNDDGTKR